MDTFEKQVRLMEALFFCINYMHGLKLPGGAGAFPEVVTVQQRRRISITLTTYLLHYYFAAMSASVYLPQRCAEVRPLPNAQSRGCRISL